MAEKYSIDVVIRIRKLEDKTPTPVTEVDSDFGEIEKIILQPAADVIVDEDVNSLTFTATNIKNVIPQVQSMWVSYVRKTEEMLRKVFPEEPVKELPDKEVVQGE